MVFSTDWDTVNTTKFALSVGSAFKSAYGIPRSKIDSFKLREGSVIVKVVFTTSPPENMTALRGALIEITYDNAALVSGPTLLCETGNCDDSISNSGSSSEDESDSSMLIIAIVIVALLIAGIALFVVQKQRKRGRENSRATPEYTNPMYASPGDLSPDERAMENPMYGELQEADDGSFSIKRVKGSVHGPGKGIAARSDIDDDFC